ncbi:MAG: hypothetical protein HQK52_00045 [Oligoflexia bacterium]|nr:hypothetical protein [Oligoflexia bacterium]
MTQITLNAVVINKIFDQEITVQDLLQYVLGNFLKINETVLGIQVDDGSDGNRENFYNQKIVNFKKINFDVGNKEVLLDRILSSCEIHLQVVEEKIIGFSGTIRTGEHTLDRSAFLEIIEFFDIFTESMCVVQKMCTFSNIDEDKKILFKKIESELLAAFRSLLEAYKNNDLLLLSDLLEYEINKILQNWRLDLVPKLKEIRF